MFPVSAYKSGRDLIMERKLLHDMLISPIPNFVKQPLGYRTQ